MKHRRHQQAGSPKVQAGQCSCTSLRKASRRVSQLYDAILAPCGLRITQRAILNHISRAGTPSVGELAADLVMGRGALAHNQEADRRSTPSSACLIRRISIENPL